MHRIAVIGAGHVGLVTAAAFSEKGEKVVCVDNDEAKIASIKKGAMPFFEPGLLDLVRKHSGQNLSFSTSISSAVRGSEYIFICVGTPPGRDGEADLSAVERVGCDIGANLRRYSVVIEKSTVPVETGKWLRKTISNHAGKTEFDVACNPEFLREGSAVQNALFPERIVIGVNRKKGKKKMQALYQNFSCPKVYCDLQTAELIKHASNAFLSTKISFINMVSLLCDEVGADIGKVAEGMGLDPRIGKAFLKAGIGFGGFCFPKDLQAFIQMGKKEGVRFGLLQEVWKVNQAMPKMFVERIKEKLWICKGKRIAVWGLSFKPETDDLRFSPALAVIRNLVKEGAKVSAYDPQAMAEARVLLPAHVEFASSPYKTVKGAEALLLLTEWDLFKSVQWKKVKEAMRPPYLIADGRNALPADKLIKLGFDYFGIGRGALGREIP